MWENDVTWQRLEQSPMKLNVELPDDIELPDVVGASKIKTMSITLNGEGIIIDAGDYTLSNTYEELYELVIRLDEERWKARMASRLNHPTASDIEVDVWSAFGRNK